MGYKDRKKKDTVSALAMYAESEARRKAAAPAASVKQTPPYVVLDLPYHSTQHGRLIFTDEGVITDTCTLTFEQAIQLRTALNNLAL